MSGGTTLAEVGVVLSRQVSPAREMKTRDRRGGPPSRGIDLELRHEGEIVASTVVDADDDFAFTVEFTVPDAPAGVYRVVAVEDRSYRQERESDPFVIEAP